MLLSRFATKAKGCRSVTGDTAPSTKSNNSLLRTSLQGNGLGLRIAEMTQTRVITTHIVCITYPPVACITWRCAKRESTAAIKCRYYSELHSKPGTTPSRDTNQLESHIYSSLLYRDTTKERSSAGRREWSAFESNNSREFRGELLATFELLVVYVEPSERDDSSTQYPAVLSPAHGKDFIQHIHPACDISRTGL